MHDQACSHASDLSILSPRYVTPLTEEVKYFVHWITFFALLTVRDFRGSLRRHRHHHAAGGVGVGAAIKSPLRRRNPVKRFRRRREEAKERRHQAAATERRREEEMENLCLTPVSPVSEPCPP